MNVNSVNITQSPSFNTNKAFTFIDRTGAVIPQRFQINQQKKTRIPSSRITLIIQGKSKCSLSPRPKIKPTHYGIF